MEVDRVKVALRYAQLLANGNWKTVELEASGTVSPKETWQQAQAYLYAELQKQVMEVFKLPEAKLEPAEVRYSPEPVRPQLPPIRDPMDPEGIFQDRPPAKACQPGPMPPDGWVEQSGARAAIQGQLSGGDLQHWCVIHAQKFDQHQSKNGGQSWYSHKVEGTDAWCRE